MSILSEQIDAQGSTSTAYNCLPIAPVDNPSWKLEMPIPTTPQQSKIDKIPTTPQQSKIDKIVKIRAYQNPASAGNMAVQLALQVFFDKNILKASSFTGDRGRLHILDPEKVDEIEDVIIRMYRGKVKDTNSLWESCKRAISKKCKNLRGQKN